MMRIRWKRGAAALWFEEEQQEKKGKVVKMK
jgi:hypothetical protein